MLALNLSARQVEYDGGAAKAYRNLGKIGTSQSGRKWSLIGTVATGVSTQGPVYYADINGDEKADYLVAFDGSAVNPYINSYDWIPDEGEDDGKDEDDDDNDTNECTPAPKTYSEKEIDRVGEYMQCE
ncbi:hypothetical protein BHE90_006824 [Fusarium euwallaceae]|uniref:Insecticide toxin TcdB middle/N-terminal domain-containing protein n=1 Tax=Fusarium euwallaceae TaxID=1147111 RepID=A0A430LSK3_9HYPO|nr:hypothetical protein BHE90_006824 [Fusarium euwallaceae]